MGRYAFSSFNSMAKLIAVWAPRITPSCYFFYISVAFVLLQLNKHGIHNPTPSPATSYTIAAVQHSYSHSNRLQRTKITGQKREKTPACLVVCCPRPLASLATHLARPLVSLARLRRPGGPAISCHSRRWLPQEHPTISGLCFHLGQRPPLVLPNPNPSPSAPFVRFSLSQTAGARAAPWRR